MLNCETTVDKSSTQITKPVISQNISDKWSINEIPSGAEVKWTKHTPEWDAESKTLTIIVFMKLWRRNIRKIAFIGMAQNIDRSSYHA